MATGSGVGSVGAPETTVATTSEFDAVDFFSDFYALVNADPYGPSDLSERIVAGSPADAFLDLRPRIQRRPRRQQARDRSNRSPSLARRLRSKALRPSRCAATASATRSATSSSRMAACSRSSSTGWRSTTVSRRRPKPAEFGDVGIGVIGGFERITVDELAVVIGVDPAARPWRWHGTRWSTSTRRGDEIAVDLLASAYPRVIEPRPDGRAQPVVLQFPTADLGGELVVPFISGSHRPRSRPASLSTSWVPSLV